MFGMFRASSLHSLRPSTPHWGFALRHRQVTADSAALLRTNPSQNNTMEPLASRKQLNGNIRPVEGVSGAPAIVEEITYLGK